MKSSSSSPTKSTTPAEVLISGALDKEALQSFQTYPGFKVRYVPDLARAELLKLTSTAHVLVTRSETDVDREMIDASPKLKVIARAAVGVGNIDIDYATEKGILVINTPGKNTNSAAEMTMGLMLAMFRNIPQAHAEVKGGGWDRHRFTGRELRGKRIGIVGLGNVGHRVAKFALGFDMEVFAYDPYISPDVFVRHGAKAMSSLLALASAVDVLTLHVPLNKETKGMITAEVLAAMPPNGWLINAARGGIVSEADLVAALSSGHLAGAGIDTWETEPKPRKDLLSHPHVIGAPHIGASTTEAQLAIGKTVYEQVVKAMEGSVVDYPVNLPEVAVIDHPLLKTYAVLAEKLGSLVGQILNFNPTQVFMSYRGNLAGLDHSIVRLSWMKGYASQVVDDYVSFVNVTSHMEKMGIRIIEKEDPTFASYKSALKCEVAGADGQRLTVGGVVFDDRYLRISLINDFYFEVEPEGHLLLIENHDRPGVIGDVGQFLGSKGINIDTFELSRNKRGGKAMAMIRIDSEMPVDCVREMGAINNVTKVRAVLL